MSTEHDNAGPHAQGGASDPAAPDPSMEDILASIRRILNEEDAAPPPEQVAAHPGEAHHQHSDNPREDPDTDVLELDHTMMLPDQDMPAAASPTATADHAPMAVAAPPPIAEVVPVEQVPVTSAPRQDVSLVAPEAAAAAAVSVAALLRTLATERSTQVHRGGPTIEDLVREEMRPLLKDWLDTHLAPMVERLVRAEIERVVSRMT